MGKGVGGKGWEGRLGARNRIFLTKFVAQLFCLGDILATLVFTCFWFVRTVTTQTEAQGGRLAVTGCLTSLWNTQNAKWVGGGSWWIITLNLSFMMFLPVRIKQNLLVKREVYILDVNCKITSTLFIT